MEMNNKRANQINKEDICNMIHKIYKKENES